MESGQDKKSLIDMCPINDINVSSEKVNLPARRVPYSRRHSSPGPSGGGTSATPDYVVSACYSGSTAAAAVD